MNRAESKNTSTKEQLYTNSSSVIVVVEDRGGDGMGDKDNSFDVQASAT